MFLYIDFPEINFLLIKILQFFFTIVFPILMVIRMYFRLLLPPALKYRYFTMIDQKMSMQLIEKIQPVYIFSGDNHLGCTTIRSNGVQEVWMNYCVPVLR
jgi:hypothetical protein